MHVESRKYSVMQGESHLGSVTETYFHYTNDDALEYLLEAIIDNGEVPSTFTIKAVDELNSEVDIETSEYLDEMDIKIIDILMSSEELEESEYEKAVRRYLWKGAGKKWLDEEIVVE